jgi:hypothetical protein
MVICHCTKGSARHLPLYKRKCPPFATVQKEVLVICHCTKGSARYLPLYKRKRPSFATVLPVQKEVFVCAIVRDRYHGWLPLYNTCLLAINFAIVPQ